MDNFKLGDYIEFTMMGRVEDKYTSAGVKCVYINYNGEQSSIQRGWMKNVKVIQEPLKIGDVCLFWDLSRCNSVIGILTEIENGVGHYFYTGGKQRYMYAEKLPDDIAERLREIIGGEE